MRGDGWQSCEGGERGRVGVETEMAHFQLEGDCYMDQEKKPFVNWRSTVLLFEREKTRQESLVMECDRLQTFSCSRPLVKNTPGHGDCRA